MGNDTHNTIRCYTSTKDRVTKACAAFGLTHAALLALAVNAITQKQLQAWGRAAHLHTQNKGTR